jgi:hypothetical protein
VDEFLFSSRPERGGGKPRVTNAPGMNTDEPLVFYSRVFVTHPGPFGNNILSSPMEMVRESRSDDRDSRP